MPYYELLTTGAIFSSDHTADEFKSIVAALTSGWKCEIDSDEEPIGSRRF